MTIEERAEKAKDLKNSGKYNCCQAVTEVLSDQVDIDKKTIEYISSGFAAGMGTMEGTCGALVGTIIIEGLKNKSAVSASTERKIYNDFEERCGSTICRDLKGIKTGTVLCSCGECVKNAILSYGKIMKLD